MLIVAGTMFIHLEKRAEAIEAGNKMMAATQEEDGCISYRFSFAMDDPTCILIFEEWESDAHLQAHFATAHMAEFRASLAGVVASRGGIKRYEVASSAAL